MIRTLRSVYARSLFEKAVIGCVVGAYCVENTRKNIHFEYCNLFLDLRKLSWHSVFGSKNNMADSAESSHEGSQRNQKSQQSAQVNGSNGLVLYYHHHSFYSQKVLMALCEKKIPFTSQIVDITQGEQYKQWYLKINPKGEVPVLKDGIKFIPDSVRIIDYLEDNFSNGEHSRLIPIDQGPEIRQKVIHYRTEIDKVPANVITIASFFNPEFCSGLKYPFVIPAVRNHLKDAENKSSETLRKFAEKNPESREILLQKATHQDKKHLTVVEKSKFVEALNKIDELMDEVENELASHTNEKSHFWLCSDRFTTADISLTILLDRLSRLGLEKHFWSEGKRPHLDNYYRRVQRRDSYKKTIPTLMTDIAHIINFQRRLIIGVSLVTVLVVVVGGYFYYKN